MEWGRVAGLTWHIDVHGHNTVAASHHRVGVVVVAPTIGTARERVRRFRCMSTQPTPHPSSWPQERRKCKGQ